MEIFKNNEQSIEVILQPSDVESAVRQFICSCHPQYAQNWILNAKYNLGTVLFAGTKGDEQHEEERDENGQTFDQWADDNFCR